jgi:GT2 family glycosyltransferase
VTAVIVGHDGAGWLSHGIDALQAQTRPVQRVVAVDTGSRDRSGTVLASKLGQAAVFGMDRSTGYAAAVRRALQHKAASTLLPAPAGSGARARPEQVEWIWLLHDDCEPAPDALEQLLRGAAETPTAAVLGPKLRDWTDRDVVLETGLSLDAVGRRVTGIEPREVDQGQHDGDRDVLAVSSAGMLVRRDVWDQVGGFDQGMTLFGEDIDLCWRVHAAGFRVRVITDAIVYHALAATRGRRPISVGRRARLLDRRHGLLTLLGNLPTGPMLVSLVGNLTISLVRTVFYMVAKRGTAALDEAAAVAAVVGHPLRFATARRRRAHGRRAAYGRVRADLLPGRSIRRMAEFIALVLSRSGKADTAAGHSAIDDPTEDDSLLIDTGFLQRFVTRPGVLLVLGLIIVTIVAAHALIGSGPLGGGALVPAWEGASQLWHEVLAAFHTSGIGSASAAPPSAGFVALLATILAGKTWLAVDLLLLGSVPLAGMTALLALRRVTKSVPIRVWAAASYALLPVAFGAIAAGRLGSAMAFVLIPLIGLLAGRMFSETPRLARRAAWATGLVLTVGTAFVPILWPMAVAAAVVGAITMSRPRRALLTNLSIVALTPPVLLLPWMLQLLAHPSGLLLEAGIQQPGLAATALPARSLLLLSPGGPGLPPYWASAALVLTGLAALLATKRRVLVVSGWCVALLGFGTALAVSGRTVTPAGGQPLTPWPGPALAVSAAGLLLAAAVGADVLGRSLSSRGRKGLRRLAGLRGAMAALLGLAALSAPVLAAGFWLVNGVTGPVRPAASQVIPALVPISGGAGRQLRTLVLSSDHGHISYLLLRTDSPQFADPGLVPVSTAQTALGRAVATLVAPGGGQAADQSQLLAQFDIGFVLMRAPLSAQLASELDGVAGLTGVSMTSSFDLWRLSTLPSRVSVAESNGTVVPIGSGQVGVSGAAAPTTGGILELSEPAGGWHASLNGHALVPVSSPAGSWAQAFRLPPGGGTIAIGRNGVTHDLVTALELLAFLLVAMLALPGVRTAAELEAAAAGAEQASEPEDEASVPDEAGPARPSRAGRGRGRSGARRTGRGARRGARPQPAGAESGAPLPARRAGASRGSRGKVVPGRASGRKAAAAAGPGGSGAAGPAAAATAAGAAAEAAAGLAGPPRAAWPAGQPASRFVGGPPEPRPYRDDTGELARLRGERPSPAGPAGPDDWDARRPPAMTGMSPSGSRFDEEPGWRDPAASRPRPSEMPRRDLSPSGRGFDEVPAWRDPAQSRRPFEAEPGRRDAMPSRRPFEAEPDRRGPAQSRPPFEPEPDRRGPAASPPLDEEPGQPASASGGDESPRRRGLLSSRSRADGWRGRRGRSGSRRDTPPPGEAEDWQRPRAYREEPAATHSPSGAPYRDEPSYRDEGWRDARDQPAGMSAPDRGRPAGRDWGQPRQVSAWPATGQPSWRADERGSGWPEERQQQGWPQDSPASAASGQAPGWNIPDQQGWAEQGDALEALPPVDEVHHDWPGQSDRSRRGWIAPGDETEGDAW